MAAGAIGIVNPPIAGVVLQALPYGKKQSGEQVPKYAAPQPASLQVQQLSTRDLQQIKSINIQGEVRKVWLAGNWNGIIRMDATGGDLLLFNGQTWKVVTVLEQWPEWTSVGCVLGPTPAANSIAAAATAQTQGVYDGSTYG